MAATDLTLTVLTEVAARAAMLEMAVTDSGRVMLHLPRLLLVLAAVAAAALVVAGEAVSVFSDKGQMAQEVLMLVAAEALEALRLRV
jgi:hypothetical protein